MMDPFFMGPPVSLGYVVVEMRDLIEQTERALGNQTIPEADYTIRTHHERLFHDATCVREILKYDHLLEQDEKPYAAACLAMFADQIVMSMVFVKSMRPLLQNPYLVDEWRILAATARMCSNRLHE